MEEGSSTKETMLPSKGFEYLSPIPRSTAVMDPNAQSFHPHGSTGSSFILREASPGLTTTPLDSSSTPSPDDGIVKINPPSQDSSRFFLPPVRQNGPGSPAYSRSLSNSSNQDFLQYPHSPLPSSYSQYNQESISSIGSHALPSPQDMSRSNLEGRNRRFSASNAHNYNNFAHSPTSRPIGSPRIHNPITNNQSSTLNTPTSSIFSPILPAMGGPVTRSSSDNDNQSVTPPHRFQQNHLRLSLTGMSLYTNQSAPLNCALPPPPNSAMPPFPYVNSGLSSSNIKRNSKGQNDSKSNEHRQGSAPNAFPQYTYDPYRVYQWNLQENIKLNKILNAIAKGCKKNSCFKVEDKLLRTISKFIQGECKAMPDISSFGIAINAWARRGERGSAERAEALLHRMTALYDARIILSKPDARMYTTVIGAWSRSHDDGRATRAETLLNYMETRYKNGDYDVKPNVRTYGAVLHAFAKSGEPGAAERAQELLNRMETMYQKGDVDVKPNVITYNAVITAHAKSRDKGRAEKAEALLRRMQELYEQGNEDVKPDVVTYNSVIDAWAKAGERGSAVHAEELLNRMQELYRAGCTELKPNEQTYDIVLNAWALSGEEGAARRAEEILNHMENLYQQGKNTDVRPSTVSYSSVINAWARSGEDCAPYRAEQILRHMERLYEEGNENLKPDKVLYIAVINAWGRCREKEEAGKRIEILREQIRMLTRERDRRSSNGSIPAWK